MYCSSSVQCSDGGAANGYSTDFCSYSALCEACPLWNVADAGRDAPIHGDCFNPCAYPFVPAVFGSTNFYDYDDVCTALNFRVSPFVALIITLLIVSPLLLTILVEFGCRPHLLTVQVVQISSVVVFPMSNYVVNFFAVLMTTWTHPIMFTIACALLCLQNLCWMIVELKERVDSGDRRYIPRFYLFGGTISHLWSQYDQVGDDLCGFGTVTVMLIPFLLVNTVWMVPMVILLYFGYATRLAAFINVKEAWYNIWSDRLLAHEEEEEEAVQPSAIELRRARHRRVAAIGSTNSYEAAAHEESPVDAASIPRPPHREAASAFLTSATTAFDSAGIDTADLTDIQLEGVSSVDAAATSMQPMPPSPPRPSSTPATPSSAPTTHTPQRREEIKPVLNVLRWLQQDTSQFMYESLPLTVLLLVNLIIIGHDVNEPLIMAAMTLTMISAIQQAVTLAFRMGFRMGISDQPNAEALAQALAFEVVNRSPLSLLNLDPSSPPPRPPLSPPPSTSLPQPRAVSRPVDQLEEGGVSAGPPTHSVDDRPSPPPPPPNNRSMVLTWAESLLTSIGFVRPPTTPRQPPSETATSTANTPSETTLTETLPPQLMHLFHRHQQNTYRYMEDVEDRTGLRLAMLESKLDALMPLLVMMESPTVPVGSGDVPTLLSTSVQPSQAVAAPPAPVQAVAAPPPPLPPAVSVVTRPPAARAPVAGVSVPVAVPSPVGPTPPAHPSSSSASSSPSPLVVARPNMQYYYLR